MRKVDNQDHSARGFLWSARHASGRSPVRAPPFSAARRAMRLDRGGVDRQGHAVLPAMGQRLEDRLPTSALGPAIEAIVVRTVFGRAVAPACATLEHVHDAADDASIIPALGSGQIGRQVRRDARPLPIIQPEQSRAHQFLPCRIARHKRITVPQLGTDPSGSTPTGGPRLSDKVDPPTLEIASSPIPSGDSI
jgi:hypothetical protein